MMTVVDGIDLSVPEAHSRPHNFLARCRPSGVITAMISSKLAFATCWSVYWICPIGQSRHQNMIKYSAPLVRMADPEFSAERST
jgi:hypothetical protein